MSSDSGPSSLTSSPKTSHFQSRRRSKRRLHSCNSAATFHDVYSLTGEALGEGAYGRVETCVNLFTQKKFAVKMISKRGANFLRSKVLKEIELCHLCQGQPHLMSMIEYFEEAEHFYLVFEKAEGGHLLQHIQQRMRAIREPGDMSEASLAKAFNEKEAQRIIKELCEALGFLHSRGVAHRDLKPENVLCFDNSTISPVKLGDFDLCSAVQTELSTPLLQSPVGSPEYMAPEVVRIFDLDGLNDDLFASDELHYDKQCDMWSLGVLAHVLLVGHLPFAAAGCGSDSCKWNEGEDCSICQQQLFHAICNDYLEYPQQLWQHVSEEGRQFVENLLQREPHYRLTAEEALRHPWLTLNGTKDEVTKKESVEEEDQKNNLSKVYYSRDAERALMDEDSNSVDASMVTRVLHQLQMDETQRRRRVESWQQLHGVEDEVLNSREKLRKSATASADLLLSCGFDQATNMATVIESAEIRRRQICSP